MDQHAANLLIERVRSVRPTLARLLACSVLMAFASLALLAGEPADLVITNAKIYTVDPKQPWADTVAVRDGKIIFVGSAQALSGIVQSLHTHKIDAGGHLLLPGFTDSHIHFMEGSQSLTWAFLDDTTNVTEIQNVLKSYAAAHPLMAGGNPWIIGRGWNYAEFGTESMPHKKYLDTIFPDRPVFLEGFDGHTAWANSKALALAGITRTTPDPPNGKIVRDPQGEATGALQEDAYSLVAKFIPQPSADDRLQMLRVGLRSASGFGLTRILNCGNDTPNSSDDAYGQAYETLRKSGELTLRVGISNYANPQSSAEEIVLAAEKLRATFHPKDPWLSAGAVKFFLDGVIEGHTAYLVEPYSDDPTTHGALRWDADKYKALVAELDRRGFQIYTHAVGDGAVRTALDAYENAAKLNHTSEAHHRIEHIETVAASDISRFGKLGVIASMQPLHSYPDDASLRVWLAHAGADRASRAWAWKSISAAGGTFAFGSDWPVVTMNPWYGIEVAVTRQSREGEPAGGFAPKERLTVGEAVYGYTMGAAMGGRHETTEGSVEPGKVADFVIASQDIFAIDAHKIHDTQALLTILGGKVVFESEAWKNAHTQPQKAH